MGSVERSMQGGSFRRVYVWELPVRMFHWINAAAMFLLIATGLLIGTPIILKISPEAFQQTWFGSIRFIHFLSGYALLINFGVRAYWGFAGNRHAKWSTFIPNTKEKLNEIKEVLYTDIIQVKSEEKLSIGHNQLATLSYLFLFGAYIVQFITGFALYADMSSAFIPKIFLAIANVFGPTNHGMRHLHHVMTWLFIIFTIFHIYIVSYHDYVETRGTVSSMFGGWKFIEREEHHHNKEEEKK